MANLNNFFSNYIKCKWLKNKMLLKIKQSNLIRFLAIYSYKYKEKGELKFSENYNEENEKRYSMQKRKRKSQENKGRENKGRER